MEYSQPAEYKINSACSADVLLHLKRCEKEFIPPLSETVNLESYAGKIAEKSVTFEAWTQNELAGLIAVYFNDKKHLTGFITNVSVLPGFTGRGISSELMKQCINYGKQKQFKHIQLEVHQSNSKAIKLYEKFNFQKRETKNQLLILQLSL